MGPPLAAALRRRHGGLVLWSAWTLAWMVGFMLTVLTVFLYLLVPLGIDLEPSAYQLATELVGTVSLASLQYVVVRVVMGNSSGAAQAWVPVSVLVELIEYFVLQAWFGTPPAGSPFVPTVPEVVALAIFGLAQGFLLAEMLGTRVAAIAWPLGILAASALVFAVLESGLLDGVVVSVLGAVEGNAIIGAIYGGLTGAVLVALVWRSATEPAPAVR